MSITYKIWSLFPNRILKPIRWWLGERLIGRGWSMYPQKDGGWGALNRLNFNGWYNYKWDGMSSFKRLVGQGR